MKGNREEGGSICHSILTLTGKAQHPAGIEPTTSGLPGVSSTAVQQPLPGYDYLLTICNSAQTSKPLCHECKMRRLDENESMPPRASTLATFFNRRFLTSLRRPEVFRNRSILFLIPTPKPKIVASFTRSHWNR